MTSLDYQVLSRRIYSDFPVIGWLLRRWAAWQLAKDNGSGEAVAILAEVVTRSQDQAVREMALAALNQLKTRDAIDGFCRVWAETRHKDLTAILRSRRYVATELSTRVLSALKVGSLDVVKRGEVESLDFLLAALSDRDTQVATAAASCVSALENRVVIDELCRRWVESRSIQLEGVIRQGGYVASQPVAVRVLTALKLNQIQEITSGGIEVLDCVLKALDDRDMDVVRSANVCVVGLTNRVAIDELCKRWASSRNKRLEQIIRQGGYVASQPIEVRVLTALKLNQIQEVVNGGIEVLDCLLKAFDDRDMEVVRSANVCAVSLTNRVAVDELCKRWASSRNKQLEQIIQKGKYIASNPIGVRVLTALKFNQAPLIIDKEKEILDSLIKALDDTDSKIIEVAEICIRQLRNQQTIDSLCSRWVQNRDQRLEEIIRQVNYLPSQPIQTRILVALKFNQLQTIDLKESMTVDILLAAMNDKDSQIVKSANNSLTHLKDKSVIDSLSKQWINSPSKLLENIIREGGYEPEEASDKALFYFLMGQWQKYENLDFDQSLLSKAYRSANQDIQNRISDKSRKAGRSEFIKIITNSNHSFDDEKMKDQDWETFIEILASNPDRKVIWRFLYNAPALRSKQLLDKLSKVSFKWFKDEEEKTVKELFKQCKNIKEQDFNFVTKKKILIGNRGFIYSLVISPDNKILASAGSDSIIKLWSLPDGKCIKTLTGHDYSIYSLVISPDNKILASGSICSNVVTIKLWSLPEGRCVKTIIDDPRFSCLTSLRLAINPDGKTLFSASNNDTLNLWSLPDGNHIKTIALPNSGDGGLVISPNGEILAFHSRPHLTSYCNTEKDCNIYSEMLSNIQMMSSSNLIENKFKRFSTGLVYSFVVSPDSKILISGGSYVSNERKMTILSLALSADGKILACINSDYGIYLWRVPDDKELLDIAEKTRYERSISLRNLQDGKYLGTITSENTSFIGLMSPEKSLHSLAISPNGHILAAVHMNKNICLWDVPKNIATIKLIELNVKDVIKLNAKDVIKLNAKDIDEIEVAMRDPNLEKKYFNILKFTFALIRLRQQFDIDIEDVSSDIQFSEFDIEIDG